MWVLWAAVNMAIGADGAVLERMAQGDATALGDLYDRYSRLVYSLALRIVRDQRDAEEVVQDVFAQVWRQSNRYRSERGAVAAWLVTLTRSRAIDRIRGQKARPDTAADALVVPEMQDDSPPADQQLDAIARTQRVRAALASLPLFQRVAIELAFYEGLTHVEIADRLEQPLGTVKTRIRQGLLKLREQLAGGMT